MCCFPCCNHHFPEWKKESTYAWLTVKFVLQLLVAAIFCAISGAEYDFFGLQFLAPDKVVYVIIFMLFVAFLVVIYTPYMIRIAPWWFTVIAFILYFGSLIFFLWEFHLAEDGGLIEDNSRWRTNDKAFDLWTLNHFFVGVLFGVMFPLLWTTIIVVLWEFIEIVVYGVGDEKYLNSVVDVVVAIIGWWIVVVIFSRKCIPWISARCAGNDGKSLWTGCSGNDDDKEQLEMAGSYDDEYGTNV